MHGTNWFLWAITALIAAQALHMAATGHLLWAILFAGAAGATGAAAWHGPAAFDHERREPKPFEPRLTRGTALGTAAFFAVVGFLVAGVSVAHGATVVGAAAASALVVRVGAPKAA